MKATEARRPLLLALALAGLAGCAHAPPVRPANGHQDPDYPEINCDLNNTVDCRPAGR
jgi:hypothetical protein